MSIVLITNKLDMYPHINKSSDLSLSLIDNNDVIIIKDCTIVYKDILYYLSVIHKKQKKLLYVNNQNVQPLVHLIDLLGGYIYNDLTILDDMDTLNFIIDSNGSSGLEIEDIETGMSKLTKILNFFSQGDTEKRVDFSKNERMVSELVTALYMLDDKVSKNTLKDTTMKGFLLDMVKTQMQYEETIRHLKSEKTDLINKLDSTTGDSRSNTLFAYPKYKVDYPTKKVLYMMEYSPCLYLTTFLIYYTDYLNVNRNKKARMLIIIPRLASTVKKYGSFPLITDANSQTILKTSSKRVFVTYEPKKGVLDNFLKDAQYDAFVVLDLTRGEKMITGTNVVNYGAVSGASDIEKFGLNKDYTFTPLFMMGNSYGLTKITNYLTQSESNKKGLYYKGYKRYYERLDKELNLL